MNKTKIVANLGPETGSKDQIVGLIRAGINVARINLSHGDRDSHSRFIVCNVLDAMTMFDTEQTVTIDGTTGHISYGNSSSK